MIQIDTRPQQIAIATAYRENSLPLLVEVKPEIDLTGITVKVELQNIAGKKLYQVEDFTVDGQNIRINFTKEQVKVMPSTANCMVSLDGVYQYGYKIEPLYGFGIPLNTTATVGLNLKGDPGKDGDLTAEAQALKVLMDQDKAATADDRLHTETARSQTVTLASQVAGDREAVGTLKSEMNQIKSDTDTIKTDTIAIKNQAQGFSVTAGQQATIATNAANSVITKISNYSASTKAAADAFAATQTVSCFIEVLADETQGGVRALYFWNTLTLQEPLLL